MKEILEFVTINYNTPDLLTNLIQSFIKYNDCDAILHIIDGSDRKEFIENDIKITNNVKNVYIEQLFYNIHHGPGMDYAITNSKKKWVFMVDSDIVFLTEISKIINLFLDNEKTFIGFGEVMDKNGFNIKNGAPTENSIVYIHPRFMLINVEKYNDLKTNKNKKFIKHGSPCIDVMNYLYDNKLDKKYLKQIDDKYKKETFSTIGRGTCGRFGYAL